MPQAGLHGMAGLSVRRALPRGLTWGFVLGNVLPDVDMFAMTTVYPFHLALAYRMHRTFTHSLSFILLMVALFYLLSLRLGPFYKYLGYGLGLGIALHVFLDIFLWFDGVEIFWPLAYDLDLWRWYSPPPMVFKLLRAAEFLFAGLYFLYLSLAATRSGTDLNFAGRLRLLYRLQFALFVVFAGLAFVLETEQYLIPFGVVYTFTMLPLVLYVTVRMRETIERGSFSFT